MEKKELIRTVFHLLFENESFDRETIANYFSKDYVQSVNGDTFGFNDFVNHICKVRETLSSCNIAFKTLVTEGNIVFSNHLVDAVMRNGKMVRQQVLAEFEISKGKIIRCDELTCFLGGDVAGSKLGSIR